MTSRMTTVAVIGSGVPIGSDLARDGQDLARDRTRLVAREVEHGVYELVQLDPTHLGALHLREVVGGFHRARRYRVHADAAAREFVSEGAGEPGHGRLGGDVGRHLA